MVGVLCCWSQFLNGLRLAFASLVLVLEWVRRGIVEEGGLEGGRVGDGLIEGGYRDAWRVDGTPTENQRRGDRRVGWRRCGAGKVRWGKKGVNGESGVEE